MCRENGSRRPAWRPWLREHGSLKLGEGGDAHEGADVKSRKRLQPAALAQGGMGMCVQGR